MKFTKLLVLSVLALLGVSTAGAVENVWTEPVFPEGAALTNGNTYYFYNIGAGQFLYEGNDYSTQANVSDKGLKIRVDLDEKTNDYTLTDSVIAGNSKGKWLYIWFVAPDNNGVWGGRMYVDYNNQGNYLWQITDKGNNIYRLSPSASNEAVNDNTKFVGINRSVNEKNDTLLAYLTDDPKYFIDWKLIPVEAGDAYFTAKEQYAAAMKLKEVLDEAEAKGISVPEQLAIFNNTASTAKELTDAIAPVKKAIAEGSYANATAANPVNVTTMFITNPSYENNNNNGWSGTAPGFQTYTDAEFFGKTFDTKQAVSDLRGGVYALGVQAFYRAGGHGADPGYQRYIANDPGNENTKLYVVVGSDSLKKSVVTPFTEAGTEKVGVGNESEVTTADGTKIYVPNDMNSAEAYFVQADRYHNNLFFDTQGGSATIGMRKDAVITNDWVLLDNWSLTYYGNGTDAYQAWSDAELSSMNNVPAGAFFTESYATVLTAATTGKTAASKADVQANITAAQEAQDALNKNISLWNEYKELISTAKYSYNSLEKSVKDKNVKIALDDYINDAPQDGYVSESTEIINAKALDNAGLEAEIAKLQQLITNFEVDAKSDLTEEEGHNDATKYMVNPNFDDTYRSATGWTIEKADGGNLACQGLEDGNGHHINQGFEAWNNANFDVYQIVTNVPVGIYEISVQGFYRYDRGDAAYNAYLAQEVEYVKEKGAPVYVYINEKKTPFKNVYEEDSQDQEFYVSCAQKDENGEPKKKENGVYDWEPDVWKGNVQNVLADNPTMWYPNGMVSGAVAFSAGLYTQSAFSLVAKAGDALRVGVKGSSNQKGDSWVIWDNFKLTYRGKNITYVKPTLEEAIADADKVLKDPTTGVQKPLGKDAYERLQTAIAEAEAALSLTDGEAMFEKLVALVTVDVDKSIEKFDSLNAAYEKLSKAYGDASIDATETRPSEAAINAALELMTTIDNGIENYTLTDADADALMEQVDEAIKALKVPAIVDSASDENPVNFTKFITNPDYEGDSTEGWERKDADGNYGSANTVCENYNGKFDVYQDLTDLPEGTYEVGVRLFYRNGNALNEYKTFTEDPTAGNNMSLYVTIGENTAKAAAPRLARLADTGISSTLNDKNEFTPTSGYAWATELTVEADSSFATGIILPNDRATMRNIFDNEIASESKQMYASIIFKVGAEGKARIGVVKTEKVDQDWSAWSNWTLTYFGKNSAKEPGIVDGIKDAATIGEVVKTEYFNIGGARVNSGKGVVIVRQTLSNGTVRTFKKIK